jgi:hypothetical protein
MITSESIKTITPAFLKAQKSMEAAKKGTKNTYFKSSYADLAGVLEACKNSLNENGISILQPHITEFNPVTGEAIHFVETVLLHESGEFYLSRTRLVTAKQNDPQALGSSISYGRRYGLQSLISLPAADDDGEAAMGRSKAKSKFTKKTTDSTTTFEAKPQKFRRRVEESLDDDI